MSGFNLPNFSGIGVPVVRLSVDQVKRLSDEKLLAILGGESEHKGIVPIPLQQVISSELLRRSLERSSQPHWSAVPSFWLLVVSVVIGLVGAIAAIAALPQVQALLSSLG